MSGKRKFAPKDNFKIVDDSTFLSKEIIKKGTGEDHPFEGCKVLYRNTPRYDANDSSSSIPGPPEVLKLGCYSSKLNSLEICLTSMKKGEKSLFTKTTFNFAMGIMENNVELELLNWRLPDFDQDGGIELVRARKFKLNGNGLYQQAKYADALHAYNNCISCLTNCNNGGEEQQIKVDVYLNIAMCHQKLGDQLNAKMACNEALKVNPNHIKTLYLHGSLCLKSGNIDSALVDFQKVQKLDPTDEVAIRQIEACYKLIQKNKAKDQHDNLIVDIENEKIVQDNISNLTPGSDESKMDKRGRKDG